MALKVAIIGASNNREKFSNKAVRAYAKQGFEVYPVNPREETVEGIKAYRSILDIPAELDRVTVYLPPNVTLTILEEIAEKGTKELFLNPGSEDKEVIEKAKSLGLAPILACSIIDIGETPSNF
jgi:predicted CoA-binding protein